MTMAPGSSITVNGAISVGGKHTYQMVKQGPSGPYGQIDMAEGSSITLNNGANLYAWGYITGDGAITAASGSKVYEYFQLRDWRGGTATKSMNDNKEKVFPISQYYVQNIESALTIQSGAQESTYLTVHAKVVGTASAKIDFIGDANSKSLFKIANEGKLTKKYDPETDRITYTTTGSASLESLTLSVAGYNFNSSAYVLPINNNMTLEVLSGKVAVNCDAALLPGAQITIAQGAELNVASGKSLYVYDLAQWKKGYAYNSNDSGYAPVLYSPTKTGTRTLTNAKIDVNGKLTAIGSVYTTESGADICSNEGTGRFIQTGGPGTGTTTYQCTQAKSDITYVSIPITAAKLHNADGTYTETANASAGKTFTYCTCTECNGKWEQNAAAIIKNDGTRTKTCKTLKEAVDNLEAGQYIKMLHSTTEDITTENMRANIPRRVLLPTPEPAKIPIRCPLPTVMRPSTAFTPRGSTSLIISLDIGSGGGASIGYSLSSLRSFSSQSVTRPIPSTVWPKSSSPTATVRGCPVFSTIQPTPTPSTLSNGIRIICESLNPTTSDMT